MFWSKKNGFTTQKLCEIFETADAFIPKESCSGFWLWWHHISIQIFSLEYCEYLFISAFQTFKPNTRLNIFFNKYMNKRWKYCNKMWLVMKIIFTLPHGQVSIECGFSRNKKKLRAKLWLKNPMLLEV